MELTGPVTLAVLGAALLHATWNALVKSGRDPLLDTALVACGGSCLGLPLIVLLPAPHPAAWPYLAATAVIHIGYYATLALAYRAGDMSHGYPIMRGTAPLLVALTGALWLGEALKPPAWAGVALICAGVLSFAFVRDRHGRGPSRAAFGWALANAAIIALYTVVDGRGVRLAGDPLAYVAWMFFVMGLPFGCVVLALRGRALLVHARSHWPRGLAGAALSGISYGVALWAFSRAPVAMVAALRETSVVFGALIGALMLKEGALGRRVAGALIVLAGVALLRV
jgi:drug/metabolite transporter (DMT)-like permease